MRILQPVNCDISETMHEITSVEVLSVFMSKSRM